MEVTGHGNESCNRICLKILDKSCKYCKLIYRETPEGIFEFIKYNRKRPNFTIEQEELFSYIFLCYIQSSMDMEKVEIIVSDYLNKKKH